MSRIRKLYIFAIVILVAVFLVSCGNSRYSDATSETTTTIDSVETFKYVHDPRDNPSAMADIVEDEKAIYGFRPSENGSLSMYASGDWSNPVWVESGRKERIDYHNSLESMYQILNQMMEDGEDIETIARTISAKRNELRLEAYKDDPEGLEALKQRNLEKYGHEEGPLPDELYQTYGSWEKVLSKAFSTNSGMDACLGLYDTYYKYIATGQVEE